MAESKREHTQRMIRLDKAIAALASCKGDTENSKAAAKRADEGVKKILQSNN